MIIDYELLKGFERTLDDALFKGIALGEDQMRQRCAAFLKEDPAIVRRRDSLYQDLERFEAALDDLQNIPAANAGSGYDTPEEAISASMFVFGGDTIPIPKSPPLGASPGSRGCTPARTPLEVSWTPEVEEHFSFHEEPSEVAPGFAPTLNWYAGGSSTGKKKKGKR